jgi:RimJ/RimL family protein N-acetyltransferase
LGRPRIATNPDFKGFSFSYPSIIADWLVARCYHFAMTHEGTTERLILRPLEIANAEQIQEHFPHWEIVKYMLNRIPWPYPADGAIQFLRDVAIPQRERGDAWHWSLRLRNDPSHLIGVINLTKGDGPNRGFWLGLPWHGQGLMSEAAAWANDYWFDSLGFPVLRVAKAIANTASRRISEKQGMRLVGLEDRDYVSGRLPSERWEITAEEWRAWKACGKLRL